MPDHGFDSTPSLPAMDLVKGLKVIWNWESAMAFEILESPDSMLLLCPAVVSLPGDPPAAKLPDDSFNILSEAISRYHKRTRLVHYLVQYGMDKRVEDWIDEVPYVAIVVCEPSNVTEEQYTFFMQKQYDFVCQTVRTYKEIHMGTEPDAIAVIYFGDRLYHPPHGVPICFRFPRYESATLANVGKALFRPW